MVRKQEINPAGPEGPEGPEDDAEDAQEAEAGDPNKGEIQKIETSGGELPQPKDASKDRPSSEM